MSGRTREPRVVGLDIGGSKTHAVSSGAGATDLEVLGGSANLCSVGEVEAARQLDAVFADLTRADGEPIAAVCAGAAGVDTPETAARLQRMLAARAPGAAVSVVHDTQLVLAATDLTSGIVLIAGTGSVAWGRDRTGRHTRAGGWGYLLGDEGSGYGITRDAVRHTLRLADAGHRPDRLARQLLDACGVQHPVQLLDLFYALPERRYWAGHAATVVGLAAAGDPAARRILDRAAADLARLVHTVRAALGDKEAPVVLAGGLLVHQPLLRDAVRTALDENGFSDVRVLGRDPAHGAVRLARELAARPTGRPRATAEPAYLPQLSLPSTPRTYSR